MATCGSSGTAVSSAGSPQHSPVAGQAQKMLMLCH